MTPELLKKYARPVPRYTSYPTAPHFGPTVNRDTYDVWLAALDSGEPISIYIHVPFCDTLCWFCGCHTKIVNRYTPVADYLSFLEREIELVAARLGARTPVRHVHFGGGSPTMLASGDFQRLMDGLRRRFRLVPEAEIAIEIDPRGMTEESVKALARAGVTRASIGVQDFNPAVQRAVNRIQTVEETARLVEWLRDAGIGQLNVDLMYGLPLQTAADVADTVEKVLALAPARVAIFGYAHVPWMKRHQKLIKDSELPDGMERWRQYQEAAERLGAGGYISVGLDHFARADDGLAEAAAAGRLRRNFQGYTTDQAPALIGLGASSIGALPQGYVQNLPGINEYKAAIAENRLATVRGIVLDDDDRLRRDIIERLMCDLAVDLAAIARSRGRETGGFASELAALAPMREDGFVEISDERITVSEAGRPFVRAVAANFDRYFQHGQARHSMAV